MLPYLLWMFSKMRTGSHSSWNLRKWIRIHHLLRETMSVGTSLGRMSMGNINRVLFNAMDYIMMVWAHSMVWRLPEMSISPSFIKCILTVAVIQFVCVCVWWWWGGGGGGALLGFLLLSLFFVWFDFFRPLSVFIKGQCGELQGIMWWEPSPRNSWIFLQGLMWE